MAVRKKKFLLYDVPFVIKNRINKKETTVSGVTIASSQEDAKRRIKTAYKPVRFGRVTKRSKMEFSKPDTRGIA